MKRYMAWACALLFYGSLFSWNVDATSLSGRFNNVTVDNAVTLGGETRTTWPSTSISDNAVFKNITGDNTGRIKDMSIGSASYTDNGFLNYLVANFVFDNQIINVKDPRFGAKGDGVTDDQAAIQAAIDASFVTEFGKPKSVYIPTGRYRITSQLNFWKAGPPAVYGGILFGDGMQSSVLVWYGDNTSQSVIKMIGADKSIRDLGIQQYGNFKSAIWYEGNSTDGNSSMSQIMRVSLEGSVGGNAYTRVGGLLGDGIIMGNATGYMADQLTVQDSYISGYLKGIGVRNLTTNGQSLRIHNCGIGGNWIGVYSTAVSPIIVRDSVFTLNLMSIFPNLSNQVLLSGNRFEGDARSYYSTGGGYGGNTTIEANEFLVYWKDRAVVTGTINISTDNTKVTLSLPALTYKDCIKIPGGGAGGADLYTTIGSFGVDGNNQPNDSLTAYIETAAQTSVTDAEISYDSSASCRAANEKKFFFSSYSNILFLNNRLSSTCSSQTSPPCQDESYTDNITMGYSLGKLTFIGNTWASDQNNPFLDDSAYSYSTMINNIKGSRPSNTTSNMVFTPATTTVTALDNTTETPSVSGGTLFIVTHLSAKTIKNFTGGVEGQKISVLFYGDNTTTIAFDNSVSDTVNYKLRGNAGVSATFALGDWVECTMLSPTGDPYWYCFVGRWR